MSWWAWFVTVFGVLLLLVLALGLYFVRWEIPEDDR